MPEYITQEQCHRTHQTSTPENAWALVAKQASLRQPKTLEELKRAVRGAWTEVLTQRSTVPLWLTRWMRAYGSYGSCVVVTLATSYGQLATITPLRIAVLGQKQHLVK